MGIWMSDSKRKDRDTEWSVKHLIQYIKLINLHIYDRNPDLSFPDVGRRIKVSSNHAIRQASTISQCAHGTHA